MLYLYSIKGDMCVKIYVLDQLLLKRYGVNKQVTSSPCATIAQLGARMISWLSFVMSDCDAVTLPLVSWVWCGA